MADKIKVPRLRRDLDDCALEIRKSEDGKVRLSLTASSTYPVDRYFGTEVLSHAPGAIRLDRAKRGAMPLLFNHNPNDVVGMIDTASSDGRKINAEATLFPTARAAEVAQMVGGGLRNVSIGYRLHAVDHNDKTDVSTVTDWEPYEISIVSIPADPTVGVGRELGGEEFEVRIVRTSDNTAAMPAANPKPSEGTQMDDDNKAAAGANADSKSEPRIEARSVSAGPSALEIEQARTRAIDNLCKANKIEPRLRDVWVTSGASIEDVSKDLLRILEDRGRTNPQSVAKLDLSADETKRFSIRNAILACADGNWSKAGFEAECSREIAQRLQRIPDPKRFFVPLEVQHRGIDAAAIAKRDAMRNEAAIYGTRADVVAGGTSGGYLVATNLVSFIDLLRNRSVAYRMGARPLSGLVGNVTIPKLTGAATAFWLGSETTQINGGASSNQTFGQLSLTPKNVGGYTEISRQLLLQSTPDAEGIVNADLATIVGLAIDSGAIAGTGTGGQPTGILNTSGVGTASGMGTIAFAGVLDFQYQVANANVMPERGGYAASFDVSKILMTRTKFANTATPLWDGNLWDGNVCGFPGMASKQITAASMIFGDWAQMIIAEWGTLEIEVNPYANFQAGIIGVRAFSTVDVGLRYAAAFATNGGVNIT